MARAAPKPCPHPGCPALIHFQQSYCTRHAAAAEKRWADTKKKLHAITDKRRGNSAKRGYDHTWRKAREQYLRMNPLCVHCIKAGLVTPATEVDHIQAHGGDTGLFWNRSNWQALCKPCHSTKTAQEDGGLGHRKKTPTPEARPESDQPPVWF